MQDIQTLVGEIKDLSTIEQEVVQELLAIPEIATFIQLHQLSKDAILSNANTFYEYIKSLNDQATDAQIEGHLFMNDYGKIEFGYQYTAKMRKIIELKKYIECLYMDEHLLAADIIDFKNQGASTAIIRATELVKKIRANAPVTKALFISGKNGVGKTHLLAALAKEFAKKKQKVIFVFVPELIRTLKQNPYEADKTIKKLQAIPVLMLDDIGAEMQTSFSRDEILLPILNSRMNSKKLTFFSSNFSLEDLELHFTKTQYGENEPVKAERMIERIGALAEYVGLNGVNYRKLENGGQE